MQTKLVELALERYIKASKQRDAEFITAELVLVSNDNGGLWILTDKYTHSDYRQMNSLPELVYYMAVTIGGTN